MQIAVGIPLDACVRDTHVATGRTLVREQPVSCAAFTTPTAGGASAERGESHQMLCRVVDMMA